MNLGRLSHARFRATPEVRTMITPKLLKQYDLFSSLPPEDLARLATRAADIRLSPGMWLAREGERVPFFFILRGSLELTKEIEGLEIHVSDYNAGDFFGEVNALFGIPALSSLRAKTACRIAALEPQQLQELIQSPTECGKIILKSLQRGLEGGPRHAMGLPTVRVRVVGPQSDPSHTRALAFLKSNRIAYESVEENNPPVDVSSAQGGSDPRLLIDGTPVDQPWTERAIADAYGLDTRPLRSQYDVVIVGGGPAGLAASVYGASEGLSVLLVEQWAMGGQAGTSSRIENYLGFPGGISGEDLTERAVRQAKRFGAELLLTRRVTSLERHLAGDYRIILDGEESIAAKSVILATGVHWRALEVDGIEALLGRGVSYGTSGMQLSSLSGKRIFIVGGGNSAGQAAMSLANYAQTVTLLVRGETLATSMSQYLIDQLHGKSNIQVERNTSVHSVIGKQVLRAICTFSNGVESPARKADALCIMIGADASTGWLPRDLQRNEDGFICTGRDVSASSWGEARPPFLFETSLPGLFCAGDLRNGSIKRVSSAVGEGSMAITFVHQFLALEREPDIPPVHSHLHRSCQEDPSAVA
jgi:thioredoxin reductase (NADPH)